MQTIGFNVLTQFYWSVELGLFFSQRAHSLSIAQSRPLTADITQIQRKIIMDCCSCGFHQLFELQDVWSPLQLIVDLPFTTLFWLLWLVLLFLLLLRPNVYEIVCYCLYGNTCTRTRGKKSVMFSPECLVQMYFQIYSVVEGCLFSKSCEEIQHTNVVEGILIQHNTNDYSHLHSWNSAT